MSRQFVLAAALASMGTGLLQGQGQSADKRPVGTERMVSIVVMPDWVEPAVLTIPAGKTWFTVHNRSGFRDIEVDLAPLANLASGRKNPIPRGRKAWREAVDLTQGEYALTVTGRPKFRCRIIVSR